MVHLGEPQTFRFDLPKLMDIIGDDYCAELNSEDCHDYELPLYQSKSYGGTLCMWKRNIDKYITVHPVSTPSFLPVIFNPPGCPVSVHVCLYLPTSGQESQFVDQLSQLSLTLDELRDKYPGCIFFLRGDCNVNIKNRSRQTIFDNFCRDHVLASVPIEHKTYHHFIGGGLFDSNVDVILHSKMAEIKESLSEIICKFENGLVESHHDIILTKVSLPVTEPSDDAEDLIVAPKVVNSRTRILWEDENIPEYQAAVSRKLVELRGKWQDPSSKSSISILLQLTSTLLVDSAINTNKHLQLGIPVPIRKRRHPPEIRRAQIAVQDALKQKRRAKVYGDESLYLKVKSALQEARRSYKCLTRRHHHALDMKRDTDSFNILTSKNMSAFKKIKSLKSRSSCQVPYLKVGDKKYVGSKVPDGFFDSLKNLKTQDKETLHSSRTYNSWGQDYHNILKICQNKKVIPKVSLMDSNKLIFRMKPKVSDFFSITAKHYINAGEEGLLHFNFLLNCIITNINTATVDELNTVYALLLYKGHLKDKTCDSSYRTISTCPFISKALDMYLHDLFVAGWDKMQAPTQYQGTGSSHELAALMVTEVIQSSKTKNLPVFLLFLDAKSAFDLIVTEYLVRNLYTSGVSGDALLFFNHRLCNRRTFCEWDKTIMGSIHDQHGTEQGGINSSDLYKLYNNELLEVLQSSKQGVYLGDGLVVSAIGQADDVVLCSNNLYMLYNLLLLALDYCQKYSVQLSATKTKLMLSIRSSSSTISELVPHIFD